MGNIQIWGVQGRAPSVGTVTGRLFDFMNPDPNDICLEDIANGLAFQCRYNGQTKFHLSVAQHSVMVSLWCNAADALWGLFHDAGEAYLGDMVSPVKKNLHMEAFIEAEHRVMNAVALRFGLSWPQPWSVSMADRLLVHLEKRDVMNFDGDRFGYTHEQWDLSLLGDVSIKPIQPMEAKALFLARAAELGVS